MKKEKLGNGKDNGKSEKDEINISVSIMIIVNIILAIIFIILLFLLIKKEKPFKMPALLLAEHFSVGILEL